jgi:predicted dithiol-disulfide oxidoreductase (DUF899 family)
MPEHTVGTQEEWKAERDKLLAEEKELTHRGDEVTKRRQELPWVAVEKDYEFETPEGTKSLRDLFDGRSQLLIYHFMFGPTWSAGCPVCSSIADSIAPQVPHLNARDTTAMFSSRAPVEKLEGYRKRMGWDIGWASAETDFHRDLGFFYTEEELKPFFESGEMPPTVPQNAEMCGTDVAGYVAEGPGLSVYALDDDGMVYRTYVTTSRGLEGPAMAFYGLLDRTPKGRNEPPDEPLWIRRHDEYETS